MCMPAYCMANRWKMLPTMSLSGNEHVRKSLKKCKAELEEWKATFVSEHGRKPSRDDLQNDVTGSELFSRFVQASKLGCF